MNVKAFPPAVHRKRPVDYQSTNQDHTEDSIQHDGSDDTLHHFLDKTTLHIFRGRREREVKLRTSSKIKCSK